MGNKKVTISEGAYYFIPGHHKLIYCHSTENGEVGLFGGMSIFLNDSRTNINRFKLSIDEFQLLNPKKLDTDKLDQYKFMQKHPLLTAHCWGVSIVVQHKILMNPYPKIQKRLPSLVKTIITNY